MPTDLLHFIAYHHDRHTREHTHLGSFETCPRCECRRARQIEIYLILTGQWIAAAYGWLATGGRG